MMVTLMSHGSKCCMGVTADSAAVPDFDLMITCLQEALDQILRDKVLPRRAVETLAFFAYPLAASLLIQLPGLSSTALGIGQAVLAAGLIVLAAVIDVPRWRQERGDPLSWRLGHIVPAIVIIVLAAVGAAATVTTSIGGLYWLAAAMAVATAMGLVNSWVLLVEIKR